MGPSPPTTEGTAGCRTAQGRHSTAARAFNVPRMAGAAMEAEPDSTR